MLDPGPVAVNWRGQAASAVTAGFSVAALWELIVAGVGGFEGGRFLVRAVLLAVFCLAMVAYLAVRLWLAGRHGRFVVVLRGYDRERVDDYRRELAAARGRGIPDPPPPGFPIALRGYEPTQVDEWLASNATHA